MSAQEVGLAKSIITLLGMDVGSHAATFGLRLLLAGMVGPYNYGVFSLIMLVQEYSEKLGRFGIDDAAIYWAGKTKERLSQIISNLGLLTILLSLIPTFLVYWKWDLFSHWMLKDAAVESAWIWLVLLSLPAVFLVRSIAKVFLSLDEISAYNLIGYAPSVVGLGVGISGMVFLGTGLGSLFLGFAIAYYGAVLLGLCYLGRRVPLKLNIKLTVIRDLFGYGTRLYASNLVEYLHYRADILLVAYLLTPTEVGYYSLALSIVETLRKLPVAAAAALFPKMASAAREFAVALSAQACRHLSLLGVVFAIPFYLSVKVVLTVYLGDGYRPVVLLILTLLPGIIVVSLVPVLRSHFFGRGAPSYVIGASLVGLAANVLANLMLIPSFGVLGAAVSSSISYLISTSILVACFATVENVSVGAVLLPERRDLSLYRQCWPRFLTLKPRVASSD